MDKTSQCPGVYVCVFCFLGKCTFLETPSRLNKRRDTAAMKNERVALCCLWFCICFVDDDDMMMMMDFIINNKRMNVVLFFFFKNQSCVPANGLLVIINEITSLITYIYNEITSLLLLTLLVTRRTNERLRCWSPTNVQHLLRVL